MSKRVRSTFTSYLFFDANHLLFAVKVDSAENPFPLLSHHGPDGNTHYYGLDAEALHATSKGLLSSEKMAELVPMQEMEGDAWERKVLRDLFEGAVLKEIPASRKKRSVVLRWLVTLFEPGKLYPEAQVNEIIKRHHPDASALRREMIGEHLLQREQGIYWREP